jgi:hypothetical protein
MFSKFIPRNNAAQMKLANAPPFLPMISHNQCVTETCGTYGLPKQYKMRIAYIFLGVRANNSKCAGFATPEIWRNNTKCALLYYPI